MFRFGGVAAVDAAHELVGGVGDVDNVRVIYYVTAPRQITIAAYIEA